MARPSAGSGDACLPKLLGFEVCDKNSQDVKVRRVRVVMLCRRFSQSLQLDKVKGMHRFIVGPLLGALIKRKVLRDTTFSLCANALFSGSYNPIT